MVPRDRVCHRFLGRDPRSGAMDGSRPPGRLSYQGRTPELDGWRAIAAIGVVLLHLRSQPIFWMWSFVDLFLVLAGFLISRIVTQSHQGAGFSLRNSWVRRILRIWPVYYVAIAGV